ncbi:unnamed protein product, partial [Tuber aestivum]
EVLSFPPTTQDAKHLFHKARKRGKLCRPMPHMAEFSRNGISSAIRESYRYCGICRWSTRAGALRPITLPALVTWPISLSPILYLYSPLCRSNHQEEGSPQRLTGVVSHSIVNSRGQGRVKLSTSTPLASTLQAFPPVTAHPRCCRIFAAITQMQSCCRRAGSIVSCQCAFTRDPLRLEALGVGGEESSLVVVGTAVAPIVA